MYFALVIKRKFGKLCDKSLLHKNTPKLSREVLGEPERQIINRCYQEESFGGHQTPETPHDLHILKKMSKKQSNEICGPPRKQPT